MLPQGQDFFSPSELLFAALLLVNTLAPGVASWALAADRRFGRDRSLRILRRLAIGDGAYVALVLLTSFQRPEGAAATLRLPTDQSDR